MSAVARRVAKTVEADDLYVGDAPEGGEMERRRLEASVHQDADSPSLEIARVSAFDGEHRSVRPLEESIRVSREGELGRQPESVARAQAHGRMSRGAIVGTRRKQRSIAMLPRPPFEHGVRPVR